MNVVNLQRLTDVGSIMLNFGFDTDLTQSYKELSLRKKNPKRRSEHRTVYKADRELAQFHKNLLVSIEKIIDQDIDSYIHTSCFGFVKNRGVFGNASAHLNKRVLLQLDVDSFFPSIDVAEVKNVFVKLGANTEVSDFLSNLCCVEGKLAEGFNASPIIANIFFYELDILISNYAKSIDCVYTRYADDITISCDSHINKELIIKEIETILKTKKLFLNHSKTRLSVRGMAQYVTGLSISNTRNPMIPKKIKRRLRSDLYYINKYSAEEHFLKICDLKQTSIETEIMKFIGHIIYLMSIEKELGSKYLDAALKHEIISEEFFHMKEKYAKTTEGSLYLYIDESLNKNKTTFSMACVLVEDKQIKPIREILEKTKSDTFSDQTLIMSSKTELIHYVDNSDTVRRRVIDSLRDQPFSCYFIQRSVSGDYDQTIYFDTLRRLLFDRIIKHSHSNILVCVEQNGKVTKKSIAEMSKYFSSKHQSIEVRTVDKSDILTSLPDYMLGIYKDTMLENSPLNFRSEYYKTLSGKIRLIYDIDNGKYISRFTKQQTDPFTN